MSKRADVGRSWRTPVKHNLMRSFVGQEVGVANHSARLGREIERLVWVDLTAGDANPVGGEEWHKTSSPGILAFHAARSAKPVEVRLHEIQPMTYARLIANMDTHLPNMGYRPDGPGAWTLGDRVRIIAVNGSGHDVDISFVRARDAVMVFNDPNAMTEWAMRDSLPREIARETWLLRCFSTLGCNPAGLKRIAIEERGLWFDSMDSQQGASPRHRDLLLAVIERDDAQWAYLLSTPIKWRSATEAMVKTAFKGSGREVATVWWKRDTEAYEEAKRTLFLTRKERAA